MYAIDADVFIQAKQRHYGFEFCPAFWAWLDRANADGRVLSVAAIRDELKDFGDELAEWVKDHDGFFVEPDMFVVASLQALSTWAAGAGYDPAAVSTFLGSGDYFLIAQAHAHGYTVVTHEVSAPDSKKRIKIPDACAAVGVPCVNPYDMLKAEKAKFVLDT